MRFASRSVALSLFTAATAFSASAFLATGKRWNHLASHSFFQSRTVFQQLRLSTTVGMSGSENVEDFVKSEIASNKVVVFSKTYCPFCMATKNLLDELDVKAKTYELDKMDNGGDIQAKLLELSGQRTVPNVFVNGKHLGGNDDTQRAARSGKLQDMVGATKSK